MLVKQGAAQEDVGVDASSAEAAELSAIYRRYAPLVHARVRRILAADAEDIVHDVFLKLLENPPPHDRLLAWIYVVSSNLCVERLRFHTRRNETWQRELAEYIAHRRDRPLDELLADRELVRRLLGRFDARTQNVVMLTYFDEMTQAEVAEMLGLSRKTVGQRLEKFRADALKMVERWRR